MVGAHQAAVQENVPIQRFSRARDPWFFRLRSKVIVEKRCTIQSDYVNRGLLFRRDRSDFLGGMHAFLYFVTHFNRVTR